MTSLLALNDALAAPAIASAPIMAPDGLDDHRTDALLKAEMAELEVRSIAYQIKAARFPAYKDLAGFDFASSEVNEALVRQRVNGRVKVRGSVKVKFPTLRFW
jgi:uncharacterized membrane protein